METTGIIPETLNPVQIPCGGDLESLRMLRSLRKKSALETGQSRKGFMR